MNTMSKLTILSPLLVCAAMASFTNAAHATSPTFLAKPAPAALLGTTQSLPAPDTTTAFAAQIFHDAINPQPLPPGGPRKNGTSSRRPA